MIMRREVPLPLINYIIYVIGVKGYTWKVKRRAAPIVKN